MTATLTCAHCGGGLAQGDRFCAQCGAEVLSCPNCGESLLPTDHSCPECGTPAEPISLHSSLSFQSTDLQSPWEDMVERLRRATLGEFEIGRELGRGGMAAVFLAHEISLARRVAIKVMSPGLLLDDGMIDRFRHEAITIAHLHHPNIVSVYSVRQAEGLHFFVMQYVQGRSLDLVVQRGGRLPVPVVRSILFQVGSALAYAHRSRVIHRDIKPANILIDGEGNAIVTDFGIAKAAETPSQTLTGALVGTPAYMSPEQCRGTEVSGASDQYSLGAVAYEMLTGVPPFSGSTLTIMQAHVERPPLPIREFAADCPPELESAILRMLEKDPAARWPRMTDAIMALGAAALAEDDLLRIELSGLAAPAGPASLSEDPTPTSPAPRTRPSGVQGEKAGTPVRGISILPAPAALEVGDSFVLVATVRGQSGAILPSSAVTWSSDPPDVLRFDSRGGEAVALGTGSTLLTATCEGVQAVLHVDVAAPRADEITIGSLDHAVGVGDEIQLETVVWDKRGQPISRSVAWQSADASIATVTAEGALIARQPGLTRITAAVDNARASVVIPIVPGRVAAIHVAAQPPIVPPGESFEVVAIPVDRWGSPLPGRRVRWSSSDARVAVATAEGRVHTVHPGSVVLTASCEGVSESVKVSVGEEAGNSEVAGSERPIKRRRSRRSRRWKLRAAAVGAMLAVGGLWLFGRSRVPRSPITPPITVVAALPEQHATAEPAPIAVDSAPVVIPPRHGRRPAPARVVAAGEAPRDSVPILEQPSAAALDVGDSMAPETVAFKAADTATTLTQGDGGSAAPAPAVSRPAGLGVQIQGLRPLVVGETLALWVELEDENGRALTGRRVVWMSSNPAVASVDAISGMVAARSAGTAVITAMSEGRRGSAGIAVSPETESSRERQRVEARILAGVEQCYAALASKDVARVAELYHASTRSDYDKLSKLKSILQNREWSAAVGQRVDRNKQISPEAATMEFSFRLTWKDAFGGHLSSQPVFRAEFVRTADQWEMSSCRIVGAPKL